MFVLNEFEQILLSGYKMRCEPTGSTAQRVPGRGRSFYRFTSAEQKLTAAESHHIIKLHVRINTSLILIKYDPFVHGAL